MSTSMDAATATVLRLQRAVRDKTATVEQLRQYRDALRFTRQGDKISAAEIKAEIRLREADTDRARRLRKALRVLRNCGYRHDADRIGIKESETGARFEDQVGGWERAEMYYEAITDALPYLTATAKRRDGYGEPCWCVSARGFHSRECRALSWLAHVAGIRLRHPLEDDPA